MGTLEVLAETTSKAENVYNALLEKIVDGDYPPGYSLSIREISQQLEVSRTPVKEAFSRLVYDGYVEPLPNRSFIVARISTTEVLELLEVREALERSAAFYAAQRRTDADIAELQRIAAQHGAVYSESGAYPAWEYRQDSVLRDTMISVFEELYGKKPTVEAIHAGLECGILSGKLPGLDAVSFGPNMHDIHTTREKLDIASAKRTWDYLLAVLKRL